MAGPWEQYQQPAEGPWAQYANAPAPSTTTLKSELMRSIPVQAAMGAVRGAGSIGATIMRALPNMLGGDTALENDQRRKSMDSALQSFGADPESWSYGGCKLLTEIAGTAGAGGLLARGASSIPLLAQAAPSLINSIRTAGMTAGNQGAIANAFTRAAGGATVGGASAAMVNPDDAAMGAAVGGALPGAMQLAGKAGSAAGSAAFKMLTPQQQAQAVSLAKATGSSIDDVISALRQQGPSLIPGSQKTVPEILQNPEVSQVARTLKSSGQYALGQREAANNAARVAALERVAPTAGTINDARANAGNAIENAMRPAELAARKSVSAKFDSIDPFGETAIEIPIDAMKAAQAKFLGLGTFGTGSKASDAIRTAERIGTETLPAIKAAPIEKQQSLYDAVVGYGGINKISRSSQSLAGEIRDLQQGAQRAAVKANNGHSVEKVSEAMFERGYLPDGDPATLVAYLKDAGRDTFAQNADMAGLYARRAESSMGDLPGAESIAKAVPFQQVQNLRSSLNEAWNQASLKGADKEGAALRGMIDAIDTKVNAVAAGKGGVNESFPSDIVATWRDALKSHGDKKLQFNTGPQAGMFRMGSDGLPAKQGAEVAPLFWNSGNAQIENVQAFKRLTKNDQGLLNLMKSNATTEALEQSARGPAGEITFDKINKWMQSHQGAAKELFNPQEFATLRAIHGETKNAAASEGLGAAKRSPTFQNFFSNGMLDNAGLGFVANKLPGGNAILGALKSAGEKSRNESLSELLSNPETMAKALEAYGLRATPKDKSKLLQILQSEQAKQLGYRAAPLAIAE